MSILFYCLSRMIWGKLFTRVLDITISLLISAYVVRLATSDAGGDWTPNSTFFERQDALLSMFFVTSNHIQYERPVDDPVFLAQTPITEPFAPGQTNTYYTPEYLVNTLACTDQVQICNPNVHNSSGCTPLIAQINMRSAASLLDLNPIQTSTVQRLNSHMSLNTISSVVLSRGGQALHTYHYNQCTLAFRSMAAGSR